MHERLMAEAVAQARAGVRAGQSPFGAVIVRDGRVVGAGHNQVVGLADSTAHAEILAIRDACARARSHDLTGCEIFSTVEPCPMCAAAIHWARIGAVYYGATIADAAAAGFNELSLPCRRLYEEGGSAVRVTPGVMERECREVFREWLADPRRRAY